MHDTPTLPPTPHRAAWLEMLAGLADVSRRRLATPRSIVATWDERKRFRWKLEQMSKDDPYLIDDIGLTRRQVEAEIVKPFWQA